MSVLSRRLTLPVLYGAVIALALVSAGSHSPITAQEAPPAGADGSSDTDLALSSTSTLGPVTAVIRLSPAAPVIGDPLTLTIEVTAEPDVEVLMPAFGEALGSFSILDFTPREHITEDGRTLQSQRYTLDVPMSGEWAIPRLVVEFVDGREGNRRAPEGEDAYELLTETIEFTVDSVLPTDAESELHPFLDPLAPLPTRLEEAAPFIWGSVFLFLILPLAVWLIARVRRHGRRRSAYEIAAAKLRKLQKAPRVTPDEIQKFYVEISAIVRRYLEDRFEIRAPERTTEEFLERASRSSSLTAEHADLLLRFLQQADLVKFAGSIPGDLEIADSVRSAERFLAETREDAPMLEVEEGSAA